MLRTTRVRRLPFISLTAASLLFGLVSMPMAHASPQPAAPVTSKTVYTDEEQQALTKAQTTNKPVPVASSTTENSQSVANPDGTFSFASTREAIRTKNAAGGWIPIDTTLTVGGDGRIRARATTLDVSLSNGGSSPAISLHKGQTGVELSMPFTLPRPVLNGATATYSEVLPGVDLQLTAHPEHIAQVLVIKNAAGAAQPALAQFQLGTSTTSGTLTVAGDGSSTVTDLNGAVVFRAAPPSMWDSRPDASGTPTATRSGDSDRKVPATAAPASTAATGRTAPSTDNKTVTLTPDPAALTGNDVVYPIYLDPSLGFSRQNFLVVRSSGQNYWTNTDVLRVGYCAWAGCTPYAQARSYVDFGYTLTPRNGISPVISSASVTFTQVSAALGGTPVVLRRSGQVTPSTGWPGPAGDGIQSLNPAGGAGVVVRFDNYAVRDYAQLASNNSATTFTFALTAVNESDANQWKKFDNNPVLNVDYTYQPLTPTDLTVENSFTCNTTTWVNTTNQKLMANVSDNGQFTGLLQDFGVYRADGTVVQSGTVAAAPGNSTVGYPVNLPKGTYYFETRSSINGVYSPVARSGNFTVATAAPDTPTAYSPDYPADNDLYSFLYGPTTTEATNQPATFTLISTDPTTTAFAYSWVDASMPAASGCPVTGASPDGSYGFILATNSADKLKTATIPYPPTLTPATLHVSAVTAAGNASTPSFASMSGPAGNPLNAWGGEDENFVPSTQRVEAAPIQFDTTMTTSIDQANPERLASGSQVRLTTTATGKSAIHTVPITTAGLHLLTIEFSAGPTSGTVTLTPTSIGTGTCTKNTSGSLEVNLYSATSAKLAVPFYNENPDDEAHGWTCPTGGGTIAYTIDASTLNPGQTIDIDYVRGLANDVHRPNVPTGLSVDAAGCGTTRIVSTNRPTFRMNASDDSNALQNVTIEISGTPTTQQSFPVTANGSVTDVWSTPLADGTYTAQAWTTNQDGISSAPSAAITFTVNTQGPTAPSITQPNASGRSIIVISPVPVAGFAYSWNNSSVPVFADTCSDNSVSTDNGYRVASRYVTANSVAGTTTPAGWAAEIPAPPQASGAATIYLKSYTAIGTSQLLPVSLAVNLPAMGTNNPSPGSFTPTSSLRILDTRTPTPSPIPANTSTSVQITGVQVDSGPIPATASAVVVNLTVSSPTVNGWMAAYASGKAWSGTSNVNFVTGQTIGNLAVVPIGTDGKITILNGSGGTIHLVVDIVAYYNGGGTPTITGAYQTLPSPLRLNSASPIFSVPAYGTLNVNPSQLSGGVIPLNATSLMISVSFIPSFAGYGSVQPTGTVNVGVSNQNWPTTVNPVAALISTSTTAGSITLVNRSPQATGMVLDVLGYTISGTSNAGQVGMFVPVPRMRAFDTRDVTTGAQAPLSNGQQILLQGASSIGTISGLVTTVTVTNSTADGSISTNPAQVAPTSGPALSYTAGQTVGDLTMTKASPQGIVTYRATTTGTVDVIVDIAGYYTSGN